MAKNKARKKGACVHKNGHAKKGPTKSQHIKRIEHVDSRKKGHKAKHGTPEVSINTGQSLLFKKKNGKPEAKYLQKEKKQELMNKGRVAA